MKIKRIIVEKEILSLPYTQAILNKLKNRSVITIDRYENWFNQIHKPYLAKRQHLQLYIAQKRGTLLKEAPDAYGLEGRPHYYFIHAYNCIYECEYCYLQGYFRSPDLVLFVNHDEIRNEMTRILEQHNTTVWFHAGEFSDSLALGHITDEWRDYEKWLRENPMAKLELRTKSANLKALQNVPPNKNLVISYSLSPAKIAKKIDRLAAPIEARLRAAKKLQERGFSIGLHLDPIVLMNDTLYEYESLIDMISTYIELKKIEYVSVGIVRFPADVYKQVESNYPQSIIFSQEFTTGTDGKKRCAKPIRMHALRAIRHMLIRKGAQDEKVYLCMETS